MEGGSGRMTVDYLTPDQLMVFHEDEVTMPTALKYAEEMEKAKTPFITVEKTGSDKFNVIGGFKYINGIRLLRKDIDLYCTVLEPFKDEKSRKLATLQRCLIHNEKLIYKEILVHELTKIHKMNEKDIAAELGQNAHKIKKYMYKQIIPRTYIEEAERLGVKHLIQAIYLANRFSPFEQRVLTELCLYPVEKYRFKSNHLNIYKRYRKNYVLFDNFYAAQNQVSQAINSDKKNEQYWESIPHPKKVKKKKTFYIDKLHHQ